MMAVGIVLGISQPGVLGLIGVLIALVTGTPPSPASSPFVLALPWIGIAVLSFYIKQNSQHGTRTWLLAVTIVLCNILVRVKYSSYLGYLGQFFGNVRGVALVCWNPAFTHHCSGGSGPSILVQQQFCLPWEQPLPGIRC